MFQVYRHPLSATPRFGFKLPTYPRSKWSLVRAPPESLPTGREGIYGLLSYIVSHRILATTEEHEFLPGISLNPYVDPVISSSSQLVVHARCMYSECLSWSANLLWLH
ncbi:hypothetical protein M413DRAFT_339500 [Hebeloma cylindrosporum]|uniref:Uncharacterized protein n=1 Tax=Hebeloma cylindrosporum TaxID=76867 RepID=A0A0C3C973_HEBCY|nr:hypothetical protein M413DRAFT_339500 [Hebeloma cylindrosporum h7]